MRKVWSDNSRYIKEEIVQNRAIPWGSTKLVLAFLLWPGALVYLPFIWWLARPDGWSAKLGLGLILVIVFFVAWILATVIAELGQGSVAYGFIAWWERVRIGHDTVWMLGEKDELYMRVDDRGRRSPDSDTGDWVLTVPIGGWGAKSVIRKARTSNPSRDIEVLAVSWNDTWGWVEEVMVRDRDGNRITVPLKDLLLALQGQADSSHDSRVADLFSALVYRMSSLAAAQANWHQAMDEIKRLRDQCESLDQSYDNARRDAKRLGGLRAPLNDATWRCQYQKELLNRLHGSIKGLHAGLLSTTRLGKEAARFRDLLTELMADIEFSTKNLERQTPTVLTTEDLKQL